MFYVYILKSTIKEWYYIGQTDNVKRRFEEHNKGFSKSTKPYKPFILVYVEKFNDRNSAYKREQEIKRYKKGIKFYNLFK